MVQPGNMIPPNSTPQRTLLFRYNGFKTKGFPCKQWITEMSEAVGTTIYEAHSYVLEVFEYPDAERLNKAEERRKNPL
uniref:Uncharacterized protein n=1 Tax=Arion vulgaris TaxID=1028688 RepID=A0A0B7ASZ1_9EUPU